jgi:hypothetical protein
VNAISTDNDQVIGFTEGHDEREVRHPGLDQEEIGHRGVGHNCLAGNDQQYQCQHVDHDMVGEILKNPRREKRRAVSSRYR